MEKEISKLLVVLTGSLGDVVRGMCVVDQLKRQFPTLHVSWVIDDKWSGVLSLHDQIDRVIVFERKRGWRGAIKLWRELRDLDFDVTLDLQRHFKSGLISLSSGAKRRIGFHRKNCKEFNYLFNNDQIEFYPDNFPKILHYLKFLEHLGCTIDFELSFGFEKLDPNAALAPELLDFQLPAIGIVLGSSWESKDWLPQGYYDLILKLSREAGHTIVLLGDPSQKDLSDSLMSKVPTDVGLISMVGRTSLLDLVSMVKLMDICIGPDSGPGHIAAAVGTPYVSLFGPTPPDRVAPYGNEDLVVKASVGCMPCYRKKCPGLNRLCMRLISAEQVMHTVRPLLGLAASPGGSR